MWNEFKAFAMRGPVLDLAVGFVVGAAFGSIVSSLVNDVIMPPIGLLLGKVDFSNLYVNLSEKHFENLAAAKKAGVAVIAYGQFVNRVIDFIIIAFVMFLVVKWFNSLKKPEAPAAPTVKDCPFCFSSIPIKAVRCPHCTSSLATTS